MENMDKGTWVLITRPKIPQHLSAHAQVWDFDEKRLHWASVVRGSLDL